MPWLTPDSIPEDDDCRPLSIPASSDWLALVSGALTELTKPYNWEKFGTLTVGETVAKMQQIIDDYYTSPCATCETPGGYRVTRISPTGHFEELDSGGNWVEGTGDYNIPPPEARTDGSPPDQICLAAKNAVNVLEQLYENLTDSWNSELDEAEALTAFILGATAVVGFEFAPITWSIVAFMTPVFTALYSALEFIGADLWDENVSKQIRCFLVDCATNTAGVVTFDYNCFLDDLVSLTNNFSLTESQTRLYLQITFMLYFIGGMDGLNLAGRTTEITDDDCSDCEVCPEEYCTVYDFTISDYGWGATLGTYSPGVGWVAEDVSDGAGHYYRGVWIDAAILSGNITSFEVEFDEVPGTFVVSLTDRIYKNSDLSGNWVFSGLAGSLTSPLTYTGSIDGATAMGVTMTCSFTSVPDGSLTITRITARGAGCTPFENGVDCG